MAMARILAVTWDGGGNVPPLLGVATRLRERGHHVRVLGHAQQRAAVESSGAEFVAYRHARPWSADLPRTSGGRAASSPPLVRGPVGLLAGLRGLRPTPLWNACDRVLVATDRDLEPATRDPLPPNVRHVGAV